MLIFYVFKILVTDKLIKIISGRRINEIKI